MDLPSEIQLAATLVGATSLPRSRSFALRPFRFPVNFSLVHFHRVSSMLPRFGLGIANMVIRCRVTERTKKASIRNAETARFGRVGWFPRPGAYWHSNIHQWILGHHVQKMTMKREEQSSTRVETSTSLLSGLLALVEALQTSAATWVTVEAARAEGLCFGASVHWKRIAQYRRPETCELVWKNLFASGTAGVDLGRQPLPYGTRRSRQKRFCRIHRRSKRRRRRRSLSHRA
jgi:hypothetical protein